MRTSDAEIESDEENKSRVTDIWNEQDLNRRKVSKFVTYLTSIFVFLFVFSYRMNETGLFLLSFEKNTMSGFTKNVAFDLIHFVLLISSSKNGLPLRASTSLAILTNGNINCPPDLSAIKLFPIILYILGFDVILTWYLL